MSCGWFFEENIKIKIERKETQNTPPQMCHFPPTTDEGRS